MFNSLTQKLEKYGTWQFILLFTLLSVILTALINAALSKILWGRISLDLLYIGVIDAFIVGLSASSICVYIIRKNAHLTVTNERLLHEKQARQQVEAAYQETISLLAEEKKRTEEIIDAIGLAISIQDRSFKILYQNQRHREMLGSHGGEYCYEAFQKRDCVCEGCHLAMTFKDGKAHKKEQEVSTQKGTVYLEVTASPLTDLSGNIVAGIDVVMDITEHRKAEEALQLARFTVEKAGDAVYWMDSRARIIDVNETACSMLGYNREELLNLSVFDIDPDFTADQWAKAWEAVKDKGRNTIETRHRTKDGRIIPVEIMANYLSFGGMELDCAFARDISERKLAEEALRTSESRYRAIVENQAEFVARYLPGGILTFVNDTLCRYVNIPREEMLGRSYYRFMHEEDREAFVSKIEALDLTNQSMVAEARVVLPDGRIMWHQWTHHAIFNDEGGLVEYQATGRDISDIKSAQEALKNSETLLQAIIDTEPECVKLIDAGGNLIMMNRAGLAMIEADSFDQVRGHCVCPLVAGEYLKEFEGFIKRVFEGESGTLAFEMRGLKGRSLWLETHAVPFKNEKNEIVALLGITRDITEKKKLENDLLRAQKLESLGILAGGLAHDFNNLLMGIMGNISFAKMYVEETSKVHERLEEAEKASERARELTQQLLTFSSGGEPVREAASVEKVVREMSSFALRGSNVACKMLIADSIWSAYMDSGQISQVINNIIINAKQAMPEGGSLYISCENVIVESGNSLALKEGKYIKISLTDSGVGIPREYLAKVFDPYFTTKEEGRGLGLASCYSIIKKHDGHIEVTSEPGKGTKFILYLPASEGKPVKHEAGRIVLHARQGKILVMDDQEMVRDIAGEMLKKLGYKVCFAKDGREAIKKFEEARAGGEAFDAVIMDLTVPGGMGGKEAVRELLRIDPNVKAIVSSGYSNDPITANYRGYGFVEVLAKPYKMNDLGSIVEKVLSSR